MKLRNSLLAAAMLAFAAPAAMAQSTSDVTITGTLVPGSCDIVLSNGGVANFGSIDYAALNQNGVKKILPFQTVTSTFTCSGPTMFTVTAVDNNRITLPASTAGDNSLYGLGLTAEGNAIGYFDLWLDAGGSVEADGASATVIQSANLTAWTAASAGWQALNGSTGSPIAYRSFGTAAAGPQAITTGFWRYQVTPYIQGRNQLALTQDEAIDGSATFEIVYL